MLLMKDQTFYIAGQLVQLLRLRNEFMSVRSKPGVISHLEHVIVAGGVTAMMNFCQLMTWKFSIG